MLESQLSTVYLHHFTDRLNMKKKTAGANYFIYLFYFRICNPSEELLCLTFGCSHPRI